MKYRMKHRFGNPFRDLTVFERFLWTVSVVVVSAAFLLAPEKDLLSLTASLIGVTALIFVAKGYVIGQVLTVVFAVFYGIVSLYFRYYGEMITYLGMSAPAAIASVVSWLRHPYEKDGEVEVHRMKGWQYAVVALLSAVATVIFYFLLGAMGTANLLFSTVSVTTSFLASCLTFLRSPYYALAYAANDVVLIVLWVLAALTDASSLPMIFCFVMFLLNDLYGFVSWKRMQKRQTRGKESPFRLFRE